MWKPAEDVFAKLPWKYRRIAVYTVCGWAMALVTFIVWRDSQSAVAQSALSGLLSVIGIIVSAYLGFSHLDDQDTKQNIRLDRAAATATPPPLPAGAPDERG